MRAQFEASLKACFDFIPINVEMGSKLEISPYLFSHHYGFQQP